MNLLKLNLGCGTSKIEDCINIDCEESCKPDLVHNFMKEPLPYPDGAADEIYFFHTIEHIQKRAHPVIFSEFARVLCENGRIYISYPNFRICAQYYLDNHQGQREFWEKTIYGRQLYPSDYHVCAILPEELELLLGQIGFGECSSRPENSIKGLRQQEFNFITTATKGVGVKPVVNYEALVRETYVRDQYSLTKGNIG